MGCPASDRVARVRSYSGGDHAGGGHIHTGLSPALAPGSTGFWSPRSLTRGSADPPGHSSNPSAATAAALTRCWFGLIPVRSPLLRDCCLFLGVREMVQFPRCPPARRPVMTEVIGLPHSEIVGSLPARGSPTRIVAKPRPSSARSAEASTLRSSCLPCRKHVVMTQRPGVSRRLAMLSRPISEPRLERCSARRWRPSLVRAP